MKFSPPLHAGIDGYDADVALVAEADHGHDVEEGRPAVLVAADGPQPVVGAVVVEDDPPGVRVVVLEDDQANWK